MVAGFLATQTGNKPGSRLVVEYVCRDLLTFFGETRNIRKITAADADRWHAWATPEPPRRSTTYR